ncbi:hypothetical protein [uncultured Sphingorhabdus sp.]|uniref:hypothetical protein n=1 Tax=uncultured Sphingorhabdus sp. TaxID=1686106 RepID=UPI0026343DC1|nr:hypothetical protein [uncultured Sphingorhabdus sp.]HMS19950.1 hypothetical protein [Sphingorhabdus sp.]
MSNFAKVRSRVRATADKVSPPALASDNIRIAVKGARAAQVEETPCRHAFIQQSGSSGYV